MKLFISILLLVDALVLSEKAVNAEGLSVLFFGVLWIGSALAAGWTFAEYTDEGHAQDW